MKKNIHKIKKPGRIGSWLLPNECADWEVKKSCGEVGFTDNICTELDLDQSNWIWT